MAGDARVTIRPWERRDREPVQALLWLLSQGALVLSDDAPTYVADYARGDETLNAMSTNDTPGQRTSVTRYDVAMRMAV